MDPPKHDDQRRTVQGVVAPANLKELEGLIRTRACTILDSLPLNEEFDWVERVSIELTTQMLATLFDFPFEDRHKLTYWSDVATAIPGNGIVETHEQRWAALEECLAYFTRLWNERVNKDSGNDLVSMLAHGEATKNMPPMEYLGNIMLLIIGGNDTTRNSISGGVLALNENPEEYAKFRADKGVIPNMVSAIIRWQTPLAYMRRTAIQDTELGGKTIKSGDKVVMWYASGNRDEESIERANEFLSIARMLVGTYLLVLACIAVWATDSLKCSCVLSGRKSVIASISSKWLASLSGSTLVSLKDIQSCLWYCIR